MAFRTLAGLAATFLLVLSARAEEIRLNPSHPEQYTVVKSDTLWDISNKFLLHPWQWPELWHGNDQIDNPYRLYPGDTLYFSMVDGHPALSLTRNGQNRSTPNGTCILREEDFIHGRTEFAMSEDGKLLPCIRESELQQAIRLIPAEEIANYLTTPKVVNEQEMEEAPYIVDLAGEHIIIGKGDRVYVRSIIEPRNTAFTIYRAGKPYIGPDSGDILGYEAQHIAEAALEKTGDPATLTIVRSSGEVRIGDRIMPTREQSIALHYFPRPPDHPVKGNIISVLSGVSQIARYNVVVIDKGTADGLAVGHELNIYQRGEMVRDPFSIIPNDRIKMPDEKAGTLMVFRPFEHVSYALVMKATQALHVLDIVQTP